MRLLFLVVVAILLPAVFDLTERLAAPGMITSLVDEQLSLGVSVVLLLLYAANLIYTLVTHRDVFAGTAPSGEAEWGVARGWPIGSLPGATACRTTSLRTTAEVGLLRRGDLQLLLFLQMPVILATGIFGISIYNVSNYTTMIMKNSTSRISISLTE